MPEHPMHPRFQGWFRWIGVILALPAVAIASSNPTAQQREFKEQLEQIQSAVVEVMAYRNAQTRPAASAKSPLSHELQPRIGSGWVYDSEGHIVTTAKLVERTVRLEVRFLDGKVVGASLVGKDVPSNVAVLRVKGKDLSAAPLGNSVNFHAGTGIAILGRSYGHATSLSFGTVSGIAEIPGHPLCPYIQFEAPLRPGNAGGILLDSTGRVIGMIVAALAGSQNGRPLPSPLREVDSSAARSAQTSHTYEVGFALPVHFIQPVVQQILRDGRVERGWLGVLVPLSDPTPFGVTIQKVMPGSPAAKAGLRPGDCILAVDGSVIPSGSELQRLVLNSRPGRELRLTIQRGDAQIERTVKLGRLPD